MQKILISKMSLSHGQSSSTEKEEKYGLQQLLVELLSFNKEIIYQVQRLQGKTVRQDLDEEDDDD